MDALKWRARVPVLHLWGVCHCSASANPTGATALKGTGEASGTPIARSDAALVERWGSATVQRMLEIGTQVVEGLQAD